MVALHTADGLVLNARLWARDPRRIVIYLHEYGDDQTAWWPTADDGPPTAPSALTFDFRGHGASDGDSNDVADTLADARAALAYATEQRYERIVLVGAGMGAAVAIEVAADHPSAAIGVVGLSTPAAFADLRPLDAAARIAARLALISATGDLSANNSLARFRAGAAIPAARIIVLAGSEHGGDLLTGAHADEAHAALTQLTDDLLRD